MARIKTTKIQKKSYAAYKRRYRKKAKLLSKRGKDMREDMLNLHDWKIYYAQKKSDLEKEGKSTANVNQYIVSEQAYERTEKQWRALKATKDRLLEEIGLDISKYTAFEFRTGAYDEEFNRAVSNEYWYFRESLGFDVKRAKEEISMLFYGSQ